MVKETRLQNIVNKMIIKGFANSEQTITKDDGLSNGLSVGDTWHNEFITEIFSDVKSNNFNVDIANFVLNNVFNNGHTWYWYQFSKEQLRKLNAIMKAKTKQTLQKRVYSFSGLITKGHYASLFNSKLIAEWVEFCNKHNLEHGLIKTNRIEQYNKQLETLYM